MGEAVRANKKELSKSPSLLYLFEQIMDSRGLFMDSHDWKELQWACHVDWLKPLDDLGCIVKTSSNPAWPEGAETGGRPQFNYHKFKATDAGISWWAKERIKEDESKYGPISASFLVQPRADGVIPVDGKGIGSELKFWWGPDIRAAVHGISEGFLELTYHSNGHPSMWRMCEQIGVRITKSGMKYFDAVPRLEMECA